MHGRHPIILGAIAIALAIAALTGRAVGGLTTSAGPAATPTAALPTAVATATPTPEPAKVTAADLPDGLTGSFTLRRGEELITLRLPDRVETGREPAPEETPHQEVASADGTWLARAECADDHTCSLEIEGPEGARSLETDGHVAGLSWSASNALAYELMYHEGDNLVGRELFVIGEAASGEPRSLQATDSAVWHPFEWLPDGGLLVARNEGTGATLLRYGADGGATELARTDAWVSYFYPSPDRSLFAFTQTDPRGWRLAGLDVAGGELLDFGNMGSDGPGGQPVPSAPESKSPMGVGWSPDGGKLAFNGGYAAPYVMTIVDLTSGAVAYAEFDTGYAGEIVWNAGGSRIAVSTYDPERTRHEVYVVDPATGEARYLMSGCLILWSPDGRFVAAHAEEQPGIAIADAASSRYGMLTEDARDVPVAWEAE